LSPSPPKRTRQRIRAGLRRARPTLFLCAALLILTVAFVGCFEFSGTPFWRPTPKPEPVSPLAIDRLIRVRVLGRDPRPAATLSVDSHYRIFDAATGRPVGATNPPLSKSTIRPSKVGISIDDRVIPTDNVVIEPMRDASIALGDRTYRGRLQIRRESGGLGFVNLVDIEPYLRGVLRGELPRYFHPEAFKAQCVAARTYALHTKQIAGKNRSFDVYDDEGSQMYTGVASESAVSDRAVRETEGEVCVWNDGGQDRIFYTYYASCCGGRSQHVNNVKPNDPAVPPLAGGVRCDDCYLATHFRWGPVEMTKAELTRKLVSRYPVLSRIGMIEEVRPKKTTDDGRKVSLDLIGSGGRDTLIGEDFRLSLGSRNLKSTIFTIETRPDRFIFRDGRGFGHGMGLCQFGMEAKARRAMSYRDILAAYYPGSTVKKIY
jgi:stage II sporulation protein D